MELSINLIEEKTCTIFLISLISLIAGIFISAIIKVVIIKIVVISALMFYTRLGNIYFL